MTAEAAAAIYASNVRETRAHFSAQEDDLRSEYLDSDMDIFTFDRRLARIRGELAFYLNEEAKLYRLNRDNPLHA